MGVVVRWWVIISILIALIILFNPYVLMSLVMDGTDLFGGLLCAATIGLFIYSTAHIGKQTWRLGRAKTLEELSQINIESEQGVMSSVTCSRLGLLGTIYGFILAIKGLAGLNIADVGNAQALMAAMAAGVSIALYTTFIGQATNILISAQNFNLTQALAHKQENVLLDIAEENRRKPRPV
jgi:hypothetical protein